MNRYFGKVGGPREVKSQKRIDHYRLGIAFINTQHIATCTIRHYKLWQQFVKKIGRLAPPVRRLTRPKSQFVCDLTIF